MKKTVFSAILFFLAFLLPCRALAASNGAEFLLQTEKASFAAGDTLTVAVYVNTAGKPVNAVNIVLLSPADKVAAQSIDIGKSAFGISAQATVKTGTVTIARGNIQPVKSSKALVATVVFKVARPFSPMQFSLGTDSAIVASTTNSNILQGLRVISPETTTANPTYSPAPVPVSTSHQGFFSRLFSLIGKLFSH